MTSTPNLCDDPYTELADKLAITRDEAKRLNYLLAFRTEPVVTTGDARQIIRCHRIAEMWFEPWGAAKGAEWEWLTQDRPFSHQTAFSVIAKFLPTVGKDSQPETYKFLDIPGRIHVVRTIAEAATEETHLTRIEEVLRPIAFVLKAQGHKF